MFLILITPGFFHSKISSYLELYSWRVDIECLMDILISLNKYHDEFVDKTGDEYNLPVVDLDRLRKTVFKRMQKN